MHRSALRWTGVVACAAVPAMLVAGCSSDSSGSTHSGKDAKSSHRASASATPHVARAKFSRLPKVCTSLSGKTVDSLVPKAKHKSGKALPTANAKQSGSCLWSGLDGYAYRSLTVSLRLFPSDPTLGSGDQRAVRYATEQADKARTVKDAKNVTTGTATGIADTARTVRADTKKDGDTFRDQTVVARTANVVVTVEYDGAGYETAKTPDGAKLLGYAKSAAAEAVSSVRHANA